ncbi:MAG: hypothetical protein ABI056_07620 [Caulobacteraceae bacterium]
MRGATALRAVLLGIGAAGSGGSAVASPSIVTPAFGNTIVMTYPDGRTGELWLQSDGSFTGEGRRGDRSSGHWRLKGMELCLRQSRPFPAPFDFCSPVPASYRGAWLGKAWTGDPLRIVLMPGHVEGAAAHGRGAGATP